MKLTSKTLKAQKPGDKLLQRFIGEVYDARTRDDYKLKTDEVEWDEFDKGVPSLATKE